MNPRRRDRLDVVRDGEEIEVFNWVNVDRSAQVYAGAGQIEYFEGDIGAGDSSMTPDAVTKWIAEELSHEFNIYVEDHGIEVVDIESEEVDVL